MLYKLAHFLRDHIPFIWAFIEEINACLFRFRYRRILDSALQRVESDTPSRFKNKYLNEEDITDLSAFFAAQPKEAFQFFNPHPFDTKTLGKLIRNRSFLAFGVYDGDRLIGYWFLRSFFMGKAYFGKMVDATCQGQGIGQQMCLSAMNLASSLGMHMYETISRKNPASLYSTMNTLDVKIIREMEDGYLYIEDFPKGTLSRSEQS